MWQPEKESATQKSRAKAIIFIDWTFRIFFSRAIIELLSSTRQAHRAKSDRQGFERVVAERTVYDGWIRAVVERFCKVLHKLRTLMLQIVVSKILRALPV